MCNLLDYQKDSFILCMNYPKIYDVFVIISIASQFGFFFVILFKFLTSSFQMTNTIQKKFKVSSTQLLYQSCPYQSGTLLISGPFLDKFLTNQNVFAFNYTNQVLVRIERTLLATFILSFSSTTPVTQYALSVYRFSSFCPA